MHSSLCIACAVRTIFHRYELAHGGSHGSVFSCVSSMIFAAIWCRQFCIALALRISLESAVFSLMQCVHNFVVKIELRCVLLRISKSISIFRRLVSMLWISLMALSSQFLNLDHESSII